MRLAMTCNGPGEFAGWVRPLVRTIAGLSSDAELHCFFVPDDYATGSESEVAKRELPMLHVHPPRDYIKFAVGGPDTYGRFDGVLYLGGDVMHASRLHARLGGRLFAYRYAPKRFAKKVDRAFALDARNKTTMAKTFPDNRIAIVGNLAVDGALASVAQAQSTNDERFSNGVLFMPGSRRREIENMLPFFASTAARLRAAFPDLPIAFGMSPFTEDAQIDRALRAKLDARLYSRNGGLVADPAGSAIVVDGSSERFPIVRTALAAALRSRLVVTIPGTKCIELAALGVPMLVCTPFNLPEKIAVNGALTYLNRVPKIGVPLKRLVVVQYSKRFTYFSQPNMDADEALVPELSGTITPGRVTDAITELLASPERLAELSLREKAIYLDHHGAATRMAEALLQAVA